MVLSRWLSSVFSASSRTRRAKAHRLPHLSACVEFLEDRILLSSQNLVALELPMAAGNEFQEVSYRFDLAEGQATFTEFGVFVFDADGTVDGVAPGEAGFQDAVINSATRQVLLAGGAALGSTATQTFVGGDRIGVYFCQDTPTGSGGDHISFASTAANSLRLGWDEIPPIWSDFGVPSPRWFDDAVLLVTAGDLMEKQGPVLSPIVDQTIPELEELRFVVLGRNVGGSDDVLRYQLDEFPPGATIDAVSGLFSWTPTEAQGPGTYTVTVRAFDSTQPGEFATRTFKINVTEVSLADSARLTIFVDSTQIALPANIGVQADGTTERAFTSDASGAVNFDPIGGVTLGEFFEIWRTNAGLAGNNSDAVFNGNELLGNTADAMSTVQMFVNGQISRDFDNYLVQAGDEIVLVFGSNPVLSLNTNQGSIVIELFSQATPITVDNFLNYVNDGDYLNSIFHRSVPGFVIQGGGFTTPSEFFTDTSQFSDVPQDPQILNEPGISNLRGTIAMAKIGGQPNSATNQFFVNLSDTNTFLDTSNGGFTVFGQVLDMTTVDRIEAIPVNTSNPMPYNELPLTSDNMLVVVQSLAGQGNLTGVKYLDANQNGMQDAGEAGIANVSIYIDANNNGVLDAGEISTMTDADGRYLLQATPGTYVVRAELSVGATQTSPVAPDSYTVAVAIGRVFSDLDFGEI